MQGVAVHLAGQLGNWLFRVASAARAYGRKQLVAGVYSTRDRRIGHTLSMFRTVCPWLHLMTHEEYADHPLSGRLAVHHGGNFQSARAVPSQDECRAMFYTPRPAGNLLDRYSVFVHIRGTDYGTSFHRFMDDARPKADIILRCIRAAGTTPDKAVALTDDPAYAEGLGIGFAGIYSNSPMDDFLTLVHAPRIVMSPSTFSWWAGYLGRHERVVFPRNIWPHDHGVLDNDPTSAHTGAGMMFNGCIPVL